MTDDELRIINKRRQQLRKRTLTREEAERAVSDRRQESGGFDAAGFLIGYATGIPIGPQGLTVESVVGASLHDSSPSYSSDPSPSFSGGGGDSGGGGSSSNYDSGSSSSSDSGGSSSSE